MSSISVVVGKDIAIRHMMIVITIDAMRNGNSSYDSNIMLIYHTYPR